MARTDNLLYIETEDACANCGLRDVRALTVHHIEQSAPKNEDYDNKIVLCHNCHQCHHSGKGPTKAQIEEIKSRLIVKTLTRLGLNALKRAHRGSVVIAMPFTVDHLVEWGYLRHVQDLAFWEEDEDEPKLLETGKQVASEAAYAITEKGKRLLEKWKLK
ncbi:MAG: HNH endonuclease [Proteobacteria bacterium]|nr:HNH endonuclease [Pseudomonadota bacterium]